VFKQLLTLVAGFILLTVHGYGQQDAINEWGETTTGKMARFLPKPVPGLIAHEPWSTSESNKVEKTWGDAVQNWKYLHPRAEQAWWFDDPDLAQKIAAAQKEQADFQQQERKDMKSRIPELQTMQKRLADLLQQKKYTEASAVADKIQSLSAGSDAKVKELDDRIRKLRERGRTLRIEIHGNESLADTPYRTSMQRQPSVTIKGHTVYRAADKTLGTPDAPEVFLAVYLGPEGFRNPAVDVPSLAAGPKCISVMVILQARADTLRADEAVARKMLEAIDYDGLAKLIEP
jgi:hypothetical protein